MRNIAEINNMSPEEKILFLEDLWESITTDESTIPVPDSHKFELDRRLRKYKSNPGDLLSLEELKAKVGRRT